MISKLLTGCAAAALLTLSVPALAADKGGPEYYDPVKEVAQGPAKKKHHFSGFSVEVGAGLTASNAEVGPVGGPTFLTIGDTAWSGHLGIGYDYQNGPLVLGIQGRVGMNDISYSAFGTTAGDTDIEYSLLARIGWVPRPNGDWMLYLIGGYKWADIDLAGGIPASDPSKNSWVLGGGVELMLTDAVYLGAEMTYDIAPQDDNVGGIVNVETTDYTGTVRLGYRF